MSTIVDPTPARFSPQGYLVGLGWTPGKPLTSAPHARSKPVTVAHKKNLAGLGKERDTSYNWWEAVFEGVAGKVKNSHDRTSTGLISPLPPKPKASASDVPRPLPPTPADGATGGMNMDAIGRAKMEMARRQLYAGFLRGRVIGSTVAEESKEAERDPVSEKKKGKRKAVNGDDERKKKKTKKRKEEEEQGEDALIGDKKPGSKKSKKGKVGKEHLSPEESIKVDEDGYDETREIARLAEQEEKRLQRVVKKAMKGKQVKEGKKERKANGKKP